MRILTHRSIRLLCLVAILIWIAPAQAETINVFLLVTDDIKQERTDAIQAKRELGQVSEVVKTPVRKAKLLARKAEMRFEKAERLDNAGSRELKPKREGGANWVLEHNHYVEEEDYPEFLKDMRDSIDGKFRIAGAWRVKDGSCFRPVISNLYEFVEPKTDEKGTPLVYTSNADIHPLNKTTAWPLGVHRDFECAR